MAKQSILPKSAPSKDGVYHAYSICFVQLGKRRAREKLMHPDVHDTSSTH